MDWELQNFERVLVLAGAAGLAMIAAMLAYPKLGGKAWFRWLATVLLLVSLIALYVRFE